PSSISLLRQPTGSIRAGLSWGIILTLALEMQCQECPPGLPHAPVGVVALRPLPPHFNVVREQPKQPTAAAHPAASEAAPVVFEGELVVGLIPRRRPDKRDFPEPAVLLADNAITLIGRPAFEQRLRSSEVPPDHNEDDQYEGCDARRGFEF